MNHYAFEGIVDTEWAEAFEIAGHKTLLIVAVDDEPAATAAFEQAIGRPLSEHDRITAFHAAGPGAESIEEHGVLVADKLFGYWFDATMKAGAFRKRGADQLTEDERTLLASANTRSPMAYSVMTLR